MIAAVDDADYIEQKRASRELQENIFAMMEEGRRRYGRKYGKTRPAEPTK